MNRPSETEPLTAALLRRMDEACLRFEGEWQGGRRPDPQSVLANFSEAGRDELLGELLLLEWDYRTQHGESVQPEDYAARFTSWRSAVQRAWQRWEERGQSGSTVLPATDG